MEARPLPCACGGLACPQCNAHSNDLVERAREAMSTLALLADPAFYLAAQHARRALQRDERILTVQELAAELQRSGL